MSIPPRDLARIGPETKKGQRRTRTDNPADSEALSCPLDTCRQQLAAALGQKGDLLEHCSRLTDKVSSLEVSLANAHRFAFYDELTGLPNRRLLLERFIQAAAAANRHSELLALIFFDVNNFKRVNDELGHDAGDEVLTQVASRLSKAIRNSDTACRYGGDEFVVLAIGIKHHDRVSVVLQKLRDELAPPYVIDRCLIPLSVSSGLATYPRDAQSFTDLLRLSDHSMFRNKSDGREQSGGVATLEA